jgi:hypothetical protein
MSAKSMDIASQELVKSSTYQDPFTTMSPLKMIHLSLPNCRNWRKINPRKGRISFTAGSAMLVFNGIINVLKEFTS